MLAKNMAMSTRCFKKNQPKILSGLICEKFFNWSWNYFELSTIQDQTQLSSSIRSEMGHKNVWKVIAFSIENTFFSWFLHIFSYESKADYLGSWWREPASTKPQVVCYKRQKNCILTTHASFARWRLCALQLFLKTG